MREERWRRVGGVMKGKKGGRVEEGMGECGEGKKEDEWEVGVERGARDGEERERSGREGR